MAGNSSSEPHVAILAFPFGSHPMPLFNLAYKLACAAPKIHFSFLNTSKSNNSFLPALKSNLPDNLKAYDVADGVPVNHVLTGNPLEPVELFLKATPNNFNKGLEAAKTNTGKRITCLITDVFLTFSLEMSEEMHVLWVPVWIPSPWSLSAHFYTDLIRQLYANIDKNVGLEQTLEGIPGLSKMRFVDISDEILSSDSILSTVLSQIRRVLPQATAVVMNSYQELSPKDLTDDLKSKLPNLLHLGFLSLSPTLLPRAQPQLHSSDDLTGCLSWLDDQKARSVVYVSFGTVTTPPPPELVALAEALEESGMPYLWSLKDHLKEQLPVGFLERTTMHGKVVPWTPQTRVLAHSSVCVFVTQCGFNSISESIANEVPLIFRSFFADQKMNGRMVENVWEIGVQVQDGIFTKSGILKSLQLILEDERGMKIREKIVALKEVVEMAAGSNGSAMQDFKTLLEVISSI